MTKQEQIDEMARKICIFTHHWKRYKTCKECFEANEYACQTYKNCKAFIEEGYRKLPEDSVVLSREEYERFVELEKKSNRIVIDFAKIDRWRKDGVFCAVNKIKTELNEYRLNNEYFIENEPNGNLWQMNSSIFYLEVLDKGGLIDQIAENHFKISEQEYSGIKEEIDQAVKETAEKILKDFKLWAREYQYKDTVVDENGERPMTNNEKLNYLYTYLCDKYKVEIKE